MAHWSQRLVGCAWRSWQEVHWELAALAKALHLLATRSLRGAVASWHATCRVSSLLLRVRTRTLWSAWVVWHHYQLAARQIADLAWRAAGAPPRRRACEAAWEAWGVYAGLRSLPRALLRRLVALGANGLLRRLLHGWSRWALQWGARRRAAKHGVRTAIWYMLSPEERTEWPKAWRDFFGWRQTWRDVRDWLAELPLTNLETPRRHQSHAGLVVALQQGQVYLDLVRLIEESWRGGHDADSPSFDGRRQARVRMQLVHRAPPQERDREGGWRHIVRGFLQSARVEAEVGDGVIKRLMGGLSSESARLARLGMVGSRELLIDHLYLLCVLRTVYEMSVPAYWAPFVTSLSIPDSSERMPRMTARHPLDDYSSCPAGATCDYVCLGCPTPRILLEKVVCGRCTLQATLTTEEYLAVFAPALTKLD